MTRPATLLVIDDLPASLGNLTDLLTQAGHEVLAAESGASALHQVRFSTPDLILLDVVMPGLDGYATCERLRAMPGLAGVPVIMMTSQDELGDKLRGFAAGAVDYITKPFLAEEVLARVQTHLRLRRLGAELAEQNARLAEAVRERKAADAQLAQSLDRAVLVADPASGRIQFATLLARLVLQRWFGAGEDDPALPAELAVWLRQGAAAPHIRRRPEGRVTVKRLADPAGIETGVLLLEEETEHSPAALRALGLTAREAEVLFWLAEGKGYKDIGAILGCVSTTAQKHAQRIFEKLGVENRHAAALRARETLGGN